MSNVTALPDSLADLDTEASGRILDVARPVTLDAGQFVFHLGDTCEAFVILVEGQIRVQLTSASGREVTLYRIEPGGSCLLTTSCLFSHEHYPAEAVTETQIRALTIPKPEFEQLLQQSAAFRGYVFQGFARRLSDVINRIETVALTSIDSRLATFLLTLHDQGRETVTHQDLAVELGTAREVVSRHLKRMEGRGWLSLGRGRITVLDAGALRQQVIDPSV